MDPRVVPRVVPRVAPLVAPLVVDRVFRAADMIDSWVQINVEFGLKQGYVGTFKAVRPYILLLGLGERLDDAGLRKIKMS